MGNTKDIREKQYKEQLAKKLSYIIERLNLSKHEISTTIGYKSSSMVSRYANVKNLKDNLPEAQQKNLENAYQVPMSIWEHNTFYNIDTQEINKEEIDEAIKQYKISIENKVENDNLQIQELQNLTLKLQDENKALKEELQTMSKRTPFQQNEKFKPFLVGTWYVYSFAIEPEKYHDGVILRVTNIYEDYTIDDTDGNHGYLNIREKESFIEKTTKDIGNIVLIRFFNEHIVQDILPCSISSSIQNNTHISLLNFAFMSRKRYTSKEAKEILKDKVKLQLKIDSNFLDRIDQEVKKRY